MAQVAAPGQMPAMPGMMFPGMMPQMPKLSPQCIACFNMYDKDGDKALSIAEFTQICKHMFRKPSGTPYV